MEFTNYIWQLYLDSEDGHNALAKPTDSFFLEEPTVRRSQVFQANPEGGFTEVENVFVDSDVREQVGNAVSETKTNLESAEAAKALFTCIVDEGLLTTLQEDGTVQEQGKEFTSFLAGEGFEDEVFSNIAAFSLGLHDTFPEYFTPFFFANRFDQFAAICDSFSIPIPRVPGKTQKRDRALYYSDLNDALQQFRRKHGLGPKELVAFLYDFAPRALAAEQDIELPPPSRVWFTMGGVNSNGDFELLDKADENTSDIWQGNVDTRRGDIILMWCVSPRSYLHSIWRAIGDGFADPFFYFYSVMRIGNVRKIPPISFKEFADDPTLSLNKSVKAHFQGAGGKTFPLEDYLVLLEILRRKGCDVSSLPIPPSHAFDFDDRLKHERDVEIHLVEPLLKKLGYTESDWLRQMPLRMGRGERNFPDYAVLATSKRGEESAAFLIETKSLLSKTGQGCDAAN